MFSSATGTSRVNFLGVSCFVFVFLLLPVSLFLYLARARARLHSVPPYARKLQALTPRTPHGTQRRHESSAIKPSPPPRSCCSCSRCRRRAKLKQARALPEQPEECLNTSNREKSVFLSPFFMLYPLSFTYTSHTRVLLSCPYYCFCFSFVTMQEARTRQLHKVH